MFRKASFKLGLSQAVRCVVQCLACVTSHLCLLCQVFETGGVRRSFQGPAQDQGLVALKKLDKDKVSSGKAW